MNLIAQSLKLKDKYLFEEKSKKRKEKKMSIKPDSSSTKKLCLFLVQAESEKQVVKVLKDFDYWDDKENWRDFGGIENNWGTIGNQSGKADRALVEKIINSIDHVLIGACKLENIPTEGGKADGTPQSIQAAVEKFFQVPKGLLTNITSSERSKLSERIKIIATGTKKEPCYIIADQGEGQSPQSMPQTLLSLNKSNKLKIPFVQGKFNMGGTGVLRFCGERRLKFILSKRNPQIRNTDNDPYYDQWGFTVIRRVRPTETVRSSIFRYLAPKGDILSFKCGALPVLPGQYPDPYGKPMEYGTFIKLYNYILEGRLKSLVKFELYNRLSLLIPDIALPVRLYERRKGYSADSYESVLSGLTVRLNEDTKNNLEFSEPIPIDFPPLNNQKITGKIYVFKKDRIKSYSKSEAVLFTVNGQLHGDIGKSFFDKDDVKLSYLADSLLVALNCNKISNEEKENLFMNSRDRLNKDAKLKADIEKELKDFLKNHAGLRELNNKRRQEDTAKKSADNEKLEIVLQKMITDSPTLAKILGKRGRLSNPFPEKSKKPVPLILKDFPDYFRLEKEFSEKTAKTAPVNNKRLHIQYETNAKDNYLNREKDSGKFTLSVDGRPYEEFAVNIWKGTATLNITLLPDWKVGTTLEFKSKVKDINRLKPFQDRFFVKITEGKESSSGPPGERKTRSIAGLKTPKPYPVKKIEWEEYGFKVAEEALKIKAASENGYDFYINVDNIHLLNEIKARKTMSASALENQYMLGVTLFGLAFLQEKEKQENEDKYTFEKIENFVKALSPFLLPIIIDLPDRS